MTRTQLYGLSVEADFDLHQPDAGPGDVDVTIVTGPLLEHPLPAAEGDVLVDYGTEADPWYTLTREGDRFLFRVHGVCDFEISPELDRVDLRMRRDAAPGMDAVMTCGTLLSLLLWLGGTPVLHGSAVEFDEGAIGFIGNSGQGKTTMATAMCAEGAAVITDDVLVVDIVDGHPMVRRGSSELRLRSGTESLVESLPGQVGERTSADARRVISPRSTSSDHAPLRAIVIPWPTRDGSPFRLERHTGANAALALLSFPRLMGWRDPAVAQTTFAAMTRLAAQVPVFTAYVPWGPPFVDGMGRAILEEAARAAAGEASLEMATTR